MGLPSAIGNFNELYMLMEQQLQARHIRKSNLRDAINMTPDERNISNLNKYFVYKKVRDVEAEKVSRILMDESQRQLEENTKQEASLQISLQKPTIKVTKQKRKINTWQKTSSNSKNGIRNDYFQPIFRFRRHQVTLYHL